MMPSKYRSAGSSVIATVIAAICVATSVTVGLTAGGAAENAQAQTNPPAAASPEMIARGDYLAKAADCAGCHTAAPGVSPNGDGRDRAKPRPFAGGLGMASPFGTIYSSNITPDPNAGIGRYTYDDFAKALREGVAPGGKPLYPAMPYPSFARIDDDDMHALYAYFMHGVQPVAQTAPATKLPFPFNQRWALRFWDWAFAPSSRYVADTKHDAQWNRGAYLVQSLGHCGACHTPRGPAYNELGYTQSSPFYLTGGVNDHWFAPNLTGDRGSGLGRVSQQDIVAFLRSGHGGGLVTFGSMVQVVEDSTQYLNDSDLNAVASYLKSLPAKAPSGHFDAGSNAANQSMRALSVGDTQRFGAGLYQGMCARCHQSNGMGVNLKYPRLAGNPAVIAPKTDSLIRLLVEGGQSPDTGTGPAPRKMPAFADQLTDTEMARVLTFVRHAWGNDADPVTTRDVASLRAALHK